MQIRNLIDEQGFLNTVWQLNNETPPKTIYPYLVKKRGMTSKAFDVSISGKSNGYRAVEPDTFIKKLISNEFPREATVRMKERGKPGTPGNGWLIRNLQIDEKLMQFIEGQNVSRESLEFLEDALSRAVEEASFAPPETLKRIKANYPRFPEKVVVETTVFRRNPAVIIETLRRAAGVCERCGKKAPFERRKDGSPYLEVHHKVTLASGGEDTTENAIALCPNCHRQEHYG